MKKFIGILFITALVASCHPEHTYQAEGTLTRFDYGACACCGGIFLTIDNDPATYRIDALPQMTDQQFNSLTLPKRIKFDYQRNLHECGSVIRLEISRYVFP